MTLVLNCFFAGSAATPRALISARPRQYKKSRRGFVAGFDQPSPATTAATPSLFIDTAYDNCFASATLQRVDRQSIPFLILLVNCVLKIYSKVSGFSAEAILSFNFRRLRVALALSGKHHITSRSRLPKPSVLSFCSAFLGVSVFPSLVTSLLVAAERSQVASFARIRCEHPTHPFHREL